MSDLDTTFNSTGFAITNFFNNVDENWCRGIALQPDGKIVMAGDSVDTTGNKVIALCRYDSTGTLDATFGTNANGKVTQLIIPPSSSSSSIVVYSLALQLDGKIVVCGEDLDANNFTQMVVARFTSSGVLDTNNFASPDGYKYVTPTMFNAAYTPLNFDNAYARHVAIDTATNPNTIVIGGHVRATNNILYFSLVKINLLGAMNSSFGINGLLAKNFSNGQLNELGNYVKIHNGKYLLGGYQNSLMAVAKFDTNGNVDNAFGTSGISVIPNFAPSSLDDVSSIAIQQDGKVVLGGTSYINGIACYALARVSDTTGSIDTTYGVNGNGKVLTNLSPTELTGLTIGIQTDDKIVMGGYFYEPSSIGQPGSFSLARYDINGSLDVTFGMNNNGLILEDIIPGMREQGYSLAIQNDGKILLGGVMGTFDDNIDKYFILARYLSSQEPSPPTPPAEPTTVCINTCNDRNNKCTYSDYSTFLNSKTTCRPVNQKTYKSYSSGGFKGSKGSPNSYLNSISSKFCANYADTTETSPYLRYSDLSNCCKFVCKSFTSTIPSSSCSPFSPNFTINYNALLQSNDNCPLNNSIDTYFSPVISQGTPPGGVFTISQPGISGINTLFTIDSSTGVVTIPANTSSGPIAGEYTITYTVCGYFIQWTAFVTDC
jgi:uncharacterized delta-60 repeat protein